MIRGNFRSNRGVEEIDRIIADTYNEIKNRQTNQQYEYKEIDFHEMLSSDENFIFSFTFGVIVKWFPHDIGIKAFGEPQQFFTCCREGEKYKLIYYRKQSNVCQ